MKPKHSALTADALRKVLSYDAVSGTFTWLARTAICVKIGAVAGTITSRGYRNINVFGQGYYAHRLAYLWMTGDWPIDEIDHRDGCRDNNAWANLRACTGGQNSQNQVAHRNNTSGAIGVFGRKSGRKWYSQIKARGRIHYLGSFNSVDEASSAYLSAKAALHTFQPVPRADVRA